MAHPRKLLPHYLKHSCGRARALWNDSTGCHVRLLAFSTLWSRDRHSHVYNWKWPRPQNDLLAAPAPRSSKS